ncbi:hypothetical protein Aperf_G00000009328 [Anoplocephala perfoliata]
MKRAVKIVSLSTAFHTNVSENVNVDTLNDTHGGQRLGGLENPGTGGGLNPFEKLYLHSMECGDMNTARRLIENAKQYDLDVNCMDSMGRGAIRIAIEADQIELLQMLLTFEVIELRDSLLHAISEENVQAVELILKAQSKRQQRKDLKGYLGHIQSSIFTPDITPLILAAHRDNYAIIKILIDYGHRIAKPHELRCACSACVQASREDSLQHSKLRINAYRALSSPCFIALSSTDPILTAFELSWETRCLGRLEHEFRDEYEELSKNCEAFAAGLLAQTRGSAELALVLNHDSDARENEDAISYGVSSDCMGQTMQLSRLRLAIKYKQKHFVAHPHCQQLLASLWYDGLPGFRRKPFVVQAAIIFLISLLHPLLCICYLLAPDSRWGGMLKKPFIKFICQSTSYIVFIILLLLAGAHFEKRMNFRNPLPSPVEVLAMIYFAGLFWQHVMTLWTQGPRAYLSDMWHLLDFALNSLFIFTIALRCAAWIRVRIYSEPSFLDRSKWDGYDPIFVSEGLFAVARTFAILKHIHLFSVSPHLGPLQISLGRMLNDIMKFCCFHVLVLIAFTYGLNKLYRFYAYERVNACRGKQADTEWKFARSKLWISYFAEECPTLAVPFNLIPGRTAFQWLLEWCRSSLRKSEDEKEDFEWENIKGKVENVSDMEKRHTAVMRELVNRYLIQRLKQEDGQGVTKDDLNEIRSDISSFRNEILDILRENSMRVNSNDHFRCGGHLRRRMSRRVYNASWNVGNVNLVDLDGAHPLMDQQDQQKPEDLTEQAAQVDESVRSVEVALKESAENQCSHCSPLQRFQHQLEQNIEGSYTNMAFVPEIEVVGTEDGLTIPTIYTMESASLTQENIVQHQSDNEGKSHMNGEQKKPEPTGSKEHGRADFV